MIMKEISLRAHAKINLSLEITGRRDNGYHDIDSVMQGVSLFDIISVCDKADGCYVATRRGVRMHLKSEAEGMPYDESNLAIKGLASAIDATADRHEGELPSDVCVEIIKKLPVAAGIAGGSGNAACAMLGFNAITGSHLSLAELVELGVSVGADVPFSITMNACRNKQSLEGLEGIEDAMDAARARGIGEVLERTVPVRRYVILANPGIAVSTREVYEAIDSEEREDNFALFFNRMEEYTLKNYSEARQLKELMEDLLDADEVLMSGSGPTIAAYFKEEAERDRGFEILCESMRERWRAWKCMTGEEL